VGKAPYPVQLRAPRSAHVSPSRSCCPGQGQAEPRALPLPRPHSPGTARPPTAEERLPGTSPPGESAGRHKPRRQRSSPAPAAGKNPSPANSVLRVPSAGTVPHARSGGSQERLAPALLPTGTAQLGAALRSTVTPETSSRSQSHLRTN